MPARGVKLYHHPALLPTHRQEKPNLLAGDGDPSFGGLRLELNIGAAGAGQQVAMLVGRNR